MRAVGLHHTISRRRGDTRTADLSDRYNPPDLLPRPRHEDPLRHPPGQGPPRPPARRRRLQGQSPLAKNFASFSRFDSGLHQVTVEDVVPNRTAPVEEALVRVQALAREHGLCGVRVLCESSGGYERLYLAVAQKLGIETALVSPEQSKRLTRLESLDTAKTDKKDARVIHLAAEMGKTQRHRDLPEPYVLLRHLTAFHDPGQRAMHYSLLPEEWSEYPHETGQMVVGGHVVCAGPSTPPDVGMLMFGGSSSTPPATWLWTGWVSRFPSAVGTRRAPPAFATWRRRRSGRRASSRCPPRQSRKATLHEAGARPWDRDPIDTRIVSEAVEGRSHIIDSQDEVGGYPTPRETHRPFDDAAWDLDTMISLRTP